MAIVDRLEDREIAAADLIADLGISKANLSKHMALLMHGGIVESRRDGRQIFYRLIDPEIRKACAIMSSVLYRRLKRGENWRRRSLGQGFLITSEELRTSAMVKPCVLYNIGHTGL